MIKKILLHVFLLLIIISCQEKNKKDKDPVGLESEKIESKAKAEIVFSSHPVAERYRTVITEQYNALDVNFASHYVIVTWGCGSGCVTGAMVDTRDGFVYPMPEDKEWGGNGTYIDSKKESEVLLTAAVAQSPTGEVEEERKYWEWNEDLKEFKFIEVKSVLLKNTE